MKRCSTQLDTKEMQIKMTMTCHYSSIWIDKFKILTITKFWWGYGQLELSYVVDENVKCY